MFFKKMALNEKDKIVLLLKQFYLTYLQQLNDTELYRLSLIVDESDYKNLQVNSKEDFARDIIRRIFNYHQLFKQNDLIGYLLKTDGSTNENQRVQHYDIQIEIYISDIKPIFALIEKGITKNAIPDRPVNNIGGKLCCCLCEAGLNVLHAQFYSDQVAFDNDKFPQLSTFAP